MAARNVRRSLMSDQIAASLADSDKPPVWFQKFEERFEAVFVKRLEDLTVKVTENDEKLDGVTLQIADLERGVKQMKAERKQILAKIDDLDNRGRRSNLVFHGVPESPRENCNDTVKEILHDFVGLPLDTVHVERCHRTPPSPQQRNDQQNQNRPRIIMWRSLHFQKRKEFAS